MTIEALQSWREPLAADWREQLATLESEDVVDGGRLRRLAAMRLGDSERLRLVRTLRRLRRRPEPPMGFRGFRLLLVSNRTLSYFAGDLEAAGAARGLTIETVEAGYDNVAALALDPATPAPDGRFDAAFLLLDTDYFAAGELLDSASETLALDEARARLDAIADGLARKTAAPVIVATLPAPEAQWSSADLVVAGTRARLAQGLNAHIVDAAERRRIVLFDLAGAAQRIGGFAFFDPVRFHQAKAPFSFDASPIVADSASALIAAMTGRAARALVLDLDNTLWGGVVADDGVEGIALGQGSAAGEAHLDLQRRALELRGRGIALAVCSKNLEPIARAPFRSHPDMLLAERDFAVFVANFEDKATNIARIAQELDLDVSSIAFLDDNPAERERVRSALPWAMVPEVGDDPAGFGRALVASGYFEHPPLTTDDRRRAEAYRARAEAKALQATIGDYAEYLRSLDMEMTISLFDALGRARIAQLVQKSNQFNLTTIRYSEAEIAEIEGDAMRLGWQVRLKDRFADHGMISVVVVEKSPAEWRVETWIMSCRVIERGVEQAVMSRLADCAKRAGAEALTGEYRPTARNALVRDFYPKLGFAAAEGATPPAQRYRLALATVRFPPSAIRVATREAGRAAP